MEGQEVARGTYGAQDSAKRWQPTTRDVSPGRAAPACLASRGRSREDPTKFRFNSWASTKQRGAPRQPAGTGNYILRRRVGRWDQRCRTPRADPRRQQAARDVPDPCPTQRSTPANSRILDGNHVDRLAFPAAAMAGQHLDQTVHKSDARHLPNRRCDPSDSEARYKRG